MRCLLCKSKVAAKPAPVAVVTPAPSILTLKQPPTAPVSAPITAPVQQEAPTKPMKAGDIIRHFLNRRYAQGEIIEVRARVPENDGEAIYSGVYTDHNAILRDAKDLTETKKATAIYTNLQRIKSEAECAVTNTMGTGRNCTSASDIARYTRLLIDVDTARPEGFEKSSSTDEEKARAFDVITKAKNYMESLWLAGDLYDSGNGYHNVYALDLPATEENKLLIKAVLTSLGSLFDTGGAHIDTSVFDMPRVCKLIGSYARKGENTTERPHRWSGIISEAAELRPIPAEVLVKIAGLKTAPAPRVQIQASSAEIEKSLAWLRGFSDWAGLEIQNEKPHEGGIIFILKSDCPFPHASGHHTGQCHIGVNREGKLCFSCKSDSCNGPKCTVHESCTGHHWKQFRAEIEEQLEERYAHGLIASDEPTAFAEAAQATPVATPKAEDMKATSLLIFKTAEYVARATELGFNALVAADFKPPLDPAYHRAVLFGSSQDDEFWAISSSVSGQGAHYVVLPRDEYKLKSAEYLNLILSMRGVRDANVKTPRKVFVEVSETSTGKKSRAAESIEVSSTIIAQVDQLLLSGTKERVAKGLPDTQIRAAVMANKLIYSDLQQRGTFFNANGLGYLLLHGHEDEPIAIRPDTDFLNVLDKYDLQAGNKPTDVVGKYIGVRAIKDNDPISLSMSFHYDPNTRAAYYAEQPGVLLKVTAGNITKIKNGEDGVLFTYPEQYEPWVFNPAPMKIARSLVPERGSALYDAVFAGLRHADSAMTDEQKNILLTVYTLLLFLPDLLKSKILLQMTGPTGGGKTFFLEVLGHMLLGSRFLTHSLPENQADFENRVINSPFVVFDNVNHIEPKIKSLLCQLCTGLEVARRELYTTAKEVRFRVQATAAISGIESKASDLEHTNRSLIIRIKKREDFLSSVDLMSDLDGRRNEIMSEIVHRVRMVLTALDAQRGYRPTVHARLADVATFLLRIARHEGWEDDARNLLAAWSEEQTAQAMAGDDVLQAMESVLRTVDFKPAWLTASQFHKLLVSSAAHEGISLGTWSEKAPQALSTLLAMKEAAYFERCGFQTDQNKTTGNKMYRLNPSPDQIADVRRGWVEETDAEHEEIGI